MKKKLLIILLPQIIENESIQNSINTKSEEN